MLCIYNPHLFGFVFEGTYRGGGGGDGSVGSPAARALGDKEPLTCMSILFYTLFGLLLLHVVLYLCVFVFFISDVRQSKL